MASPARATTRPWPDFPCRRRGRKASSGDLRRRVCGRRGVLSKISVPLAEGGLAAELDGRDNDVQDLIAEGDAAGFARGGAGGDHQGHEVFLARVGVAAV